MKTNIFPHEYPRRGEIYYVVDNPEQPSYGNEIWSNRCAVVVSNDSTNEHGGFVEVVYLWTSPDRLKHLSPTHIKITSNGRTAVTACEQVHSVDIRRLTDYVDSVPESKMEDIDAGIVFGFGINSGVSPQGIFKKWEKYLKTYPDLAKTFKQASKLSTDDTPSETRKAIELLTKELNCYKELVNTLQAKLDNIHCLTK